MDLIRKLDRDTTHTHKCIRSKWIANSKYSLWLLLVFIMMKLAGYAECLREKSEASG